MANTSRPGLYRLGGPDAQAQSSSTGFLMNRAKGGGLGISPFATRTGVVRSPTRKRRAEFSCSSSSPVGISCPSRILSDEATVPGAAHGPNLSPIGTNRLPSLAHVRRARQRKVQTSPAASLNGADGRNPSDNGETGTSESSNSNGAPRKEDSPHHWNEMMPFMMRLPFLYASTFCKTEVHWLEQRNRSRWWKRGDFPKIPKDTVERAKNDKKLAEPVKLLGKMLPLGVIFFCATFNLCILQNLKDSIMIVNVGAETLPFLASFGVLPASVIFFDYYNKLVNRLPIKSVFYAAIVPLLVFYTFFAAVLFPAANVLHPHGFLEATAKFLPVGLHGLLKCIENWTFSAFFCTAELWGAVVISVLFWSLANDLCSVDEAKTIYPLMGISANIALVFAGNFIKKFSGAFGSPVASTQFLIGAVMVMSVAMMGAKLYIDKKIPLPEQGKKTFKQKKTKKKKGGFREGFAIMRESPKIMNLALLVVGYSVSHRLFDIAWKSQLKTVYPTALEYQGVLADVSVWTGMATIAMMLTGKFIFQYLGWGVAAATTPVVMMLTGGLFFSMSLAFNKGGASMALAKVGAMAGNLTQVACKSAKYSLFDPAKEMVYIEMDSEEKSKGKAAVDLVGSQIGKTGASWVSQALLLTFGSIAASMPCISVLYGTVLITWVGAVFGLQKQLQETEDARKQERLATSATASTSVDVASANGSSLQPALHALNPNGINGAENGFSNGLGNGAAEVSVQGNGNGTTNGTVSGNGNGNGNGVHNSESNGGLQFEKVKVKSEEGSAG